MKNYEVVMGLEVHVELATESKLFCSCSAKFGADANENTCPACAGQPGMLPVVNKKAVELGIKAATVTNSEITKTITFDKKNYFYPDLSTGYQITQWFAPICRNGWVEVTTEAGKSIIGLKQIHIEEDAGKLVHDQRTDSSLVDYNRASVPLVEIVSMPDFRTADEIIAYLEKLRLLLTYAGISDCKMEEGSMRCDVNISVREKGVKTLGTRTEIKNMNSLKAITRAIAYESQRHIEALDTGCEQLIQQTRGWNDAKGETFPMRSKEDATDYRYFPNPDIMPVNISDEWIAAVRSEMPESPEKRLERYIGEYGLPVKDSNLIINFKNLSDIFDSTISIYNKPKEISTWILTELLNLTRLDGKSEEEIVINTAMFAKLIKLVDEKAVNRTIGKKILEELLKGDIDVEKYIAENGLVMVSDDTVLEAAVQSILDENPNSVDEYKAGNEKVMTFFTGRVMRKMSGKADPAKINEILLKLLKN